MANDTADGVGLHSHHGATCSRYKHKHSHVRVSSEAYSNEHVPVSKAFMADDADGRWDVHLCSSEDSGGSGSDAALAVLAPTAAGARARGRGRGGGRPRGSRNYQAALGPRHEAAAQALVVVEPQRAVAVAGALPRGHTVQLLPEPLAHRLGSDLQRAVISHASRHWNGRQSPADASTLAFHLDGLHCTSSAAARLIGQSAHKVRQKLFEFGWICTAGAGWLWGALVCAMCKQFDDQKWRPILAMRKVRFYETPTSLRVEMNEPVPGQTDGSSGLEWQQQTKVIQLEASLSFLVQDVATSEYILFHGALPAALQAVDTASGETIMASVHAVFSQVPEFHRTFLHFPLQVMHACTDGAGANYRAEMGMKSHYWSLVPRLPFVRLHMSCELHKTALVAKTINDLVSADTAGVLAVGLACAATGSARRMRKLLKVFLAQKVQIVFADPPAMPPYNSQVLDLFIPVPKQTDAKRSELKRRYALSYWLNADWQGADIVHFAGAHAAANEQQLGAACAHYCAWALVPKKCPVYARGRWTQYDKALQWCGLLLSVHDLLGYLMPAFSGIPPAPGERPSNPALGHNALRNDWDAVLEDFCEEHQDLAREQAVAADEAPRPPSSAEGPEAWTAFNRAQRGKAAAWATSRAAARISINLQVIGCVLNLIYDLLFLGSVRWEQLQRVAAAEGRSRKFAVTEIAGGGLLQTCVDKLLSLLSGPPLAVQALQRTRASRALFFAMTSAALCSLHALLRMRHKACPMAVFRVLVDGWDDFLKIPHCMYDEFTAALVKTHPGPEQLASQECMATLTALAQLLSTDIGAIEASHAKNRDISKMRASAWQPTLAFVSGKFVLHKVAAAKAATASHQLAEFRRKEEAQSRHKPKQKRPGGAWRAFVHTQMLKRPGEAFDAPLLHALAEQYRNLSAEEKQHYVELGFLANAAGRHGFVPFGRQPQQAQASLPPGAVTEEGAMVAADDASMLACAIHGINTPSFDQALAAEQRTRPVRRSKQASLRAEAAKLVAYATSSATREQIEALHAQGLHATATQTFEPLPGATGLRYVQCNPPVEKLAAAGACAADTSRAAKAMASSVREHWQRQHRVLCHDEQPPCRSLPEAVFPLTACCDLQICVCERGLASNRKLPLFKQRFQTAMARIFTGTKKAPSPALVLLREGRAVLKLETQQEEDWADDALSAFLEDGPPPQQAVPTELFFHVGRCNFNTFFCSVLPLSLVQNPNEDGFLELEADTGGQAAMAAHTVPQLAARCMNLSNIYTLAVYEVVADSDTVLREERMRGSIVEVKASPFVEKQIVWKGAADEARAAAPRRAAAKQQAGPRARRRRAVRQASRVAPPAGNDEYDADAEGAPAVENDVDDLLVDVAGEADSVEFLEQSIDNHDDDQYLEEADLLGGIGALSSDGECSDICASLHSSSDGNGKDEAAEGVASSGSSSSSSVSSSSGSISVSSLFDFGLEGEEEEDLEADDESVDDALPNPAERVPAIERAPILGRRAPTVQDHLQVPGLGQLRYSPFDGYLRAFCEKHNNCQRQRTCKPSDRKVQQGRPIGALIAWMRCGEDCATRDEHQKAHPSHEARCSARHLFKTLPDWNTWANYERPRREAEPEEPALAP